MGSRVGGHLSEYIEEEAIQDSRIARSEQFVKLLSRVPLVTLCGGVEYENDAAAAETRLEAGRVKFQFDPQAEVTSFLLPQEPPKVSRDWTIFQIRSEKWALRCLLMGNHVAVNRSCPHSSRFPAPST
jgi:hypothetical protein